MTESTKKKLKIQNVNKNKKKIKHSGVRECGFGFGARGRGTSKKMESKKIISDLSFTSLIDILIIVTYSSLTLTLISNPHTFVYHNKKRCRIPSSLPNLYISILLSLFFFPLFFVYLVSRILFWFLARERSISKLLRACLMHMI